MKRTDKLFGFVTLSGLLATLACSGGSNNTDLSSGEGALSSTVKRSGAALADADAGEDEGAADKVTCSVNADCDADEVCTNALCTGLDDADDDADGDDADDDDADGDDADGDDADGDDADDDDEANDKVVCSVNADCDADEVCVNALCTGVNDDENACEEDGDDDDEDEDEDEDRCVTAADCDDDEACTAGVCDDL